MSCYCKCPVALPHGAVGWSAVCDCGISWSSSLFDGWTRHQKSGTKLGNLWAKNARLLANQNGLLCTICPETVSQLHQWSVVLSSDDDLMLTTAFTTFSHGILRFLNITLTFSEWEPIPSELVWKALEDGLPKHWTSQEYVSLIDLFPFGCTNEVCPKKSCEWDVSCFMLLFFWFEVLCPSQQLWSCRNSQLTYAHFLSWASLTKPLTSTSCTYFHL